MRGDAERGRGPPLAGRRELSRTPALECAGFGVEVELQEESVEWHTCTSGAGAGVDEECVCLEQRGGGRGGCRAHLLRRWEVLHEELLQIGEMAVHVFYGPVGSADGRQDFHLHDPWADLVQERALLPAQVCANDANGDNVKARLAGHVHDAFLEAPQPTSL